jgi:hypothetical protein
MEEESALGNSTKERRRELGLSLNHLAASTRTAQVVSIAH